MIANAEGVQSEDGVSWRIILAELSSRVGLATYPRAGWW